MPQTGHLSLGAGETNLAAVAADASMQNIETAIKKTAIFPVR
jgi:hypothetical protein